MTRLSRNCWPAIGRRPLFPLGVLGGHDSELQLCLRLRLTRFLQPLT
jgi:hypothetical protein